MRVVSNGCTDSHVCLPHSLQKLVRVGSHPGCNYKQGHMHSDEIEKEGKKAAFSHFYKGALIPVLFHQLDGKERKD